MIILAFVVAAAPGSDVRDQLISAAAELLASSGIRGRSLRKINRHAQPRNVSALQDHFADRDGLVQAVLGRHHRATDRNATSRSTAPKRRRRIERRHVGAVFVAPFASSRRTRTEDGRTSNVAASAPRTRDAQRA